MADISPTEQLNENPSDIMAMGLVFASAEEGSLDLVGNRYPQAVQRLHLKKWASSNHIYKIKLIEHARELMNSKRLFFGYNVSTNKKIRDVGFKFWEQYMGKIPEPSSFNKKNRPRVKMGNYTVDDILVPEYDILIDDLIIIGWYAEALIGCLHILIKIEEDPARLDVAIDRLPNEQGEDLYNKVTLLKELCNRASSGLLDIVGVPKIPDALQRDVLTDNIAGLAYEINQNKNSAYKHASDIFIFNRTQID